MCKKVLKSYDFIIKSSDLFGLNCLFWIVFLGFEAFTDEFEVIAKLILKKNVIEKFSEIPIQKMYKKNTSTKTTAWENKSRMNACTIPKRARFTFLGLNARFNWETQQIMKVKWTVSHVDFKGIVHSKKKIIIYKPTFILEGKIKSFSLSFSSDDHTLCSSIHHV